MAWPAKTYIKRNLWTTSDANTYLRDPLNDLRAGGIAVSGQVAQDMFYAASDSQMARLAAASGKIPRFNGVTNQWEMVLPLEFAWPVGSVYRSVSSTNPNSVLGFGTWVELQVGRVTVGQDGTAEFLTAGQTGGEKTHALTIAEMPAHTHVQDSHNHTQDSHNHTQNAHGHTLSNIGSSELVNSTPDHVTVVDNVGSITSSSETATNNATTATNQNTTATNQNAGSGTAHNNLQPYITAYAWYRTA